MAAYKYDTMTHDHCAQMLNGIGTLTHFLLLATPRDSQTYNSQIRTRIYKKGMMLRIIVRTNIGCKYLAIRHSQSFETVYFMLQPGKDHTELRALRAMCSP